MVLEWENLKVEKMFLVNAAKYSSNPDLQKDLLETGELEIIGGGQHLAVVQMERTDSNENQGFTSTRSQP